MIIEIAEYAGFCYGVERAIKIAEKASSETLPLYSFGPIIHNEQVVEKLENQGVHAVDTVEQAIGGRLIIRSHGVPQSVVIQAKKLGVEIIDATCPFVRKIQEKVHRYYADGYAIIIVGDAKHPEIVGINGWCDNNAQIVGSPEDAIHLNDNGPTCLVVQTTFRYEIYEEILHIAQQRILDIVAFNTICSATSKRQKSALELAQKSDVMIVIGGKKSSNTKKLEQICASVCKKTYLVQTYSDLVVTDLKKYDRIGITAGASTPNWIIDEIIHKLERA